MADKHLRNFKRAVRSAQYRKVALAGGGEREAARRKRQIAAGRLKVENGLVAETA